MARPFPLSAVKAGMTRLLQKGGASRDSLYDLLNGYVNASRRCVIRHGTRNHNVNLAGTFGLFGWRDELWVFADHDVSVPAGYRLGILIHPTDASQTLADIHFVGPISGALYVAASFANGDTFHYYLEEPDEWSPETTYNADDSLVIPTAPNGYYYRPARLSDTYPAWTAGAPRQVGDRVEPTVANGFYYEVVAVEGSNPVSGTTEPAWPTNDGQTVFEDTATGTTGSVTPPGSGGGDGDTSGPCVVVDSWLRPYMRASEIVEGDSADLFDPQMRFYRGKCVYAGEPQYVECVRVTTSSGAWLEMSVATPVNFTSAQHDMQEGHWDYAPNIQGKSVWVERTEETVTEVRAIGKRWVKPLTFEQGRSFAASGERNGRRIYTHNMAKMIE
jgi:hypothetical protein